jgi:hypothetical protein
MQVSKQVPLPQRISQADTHHVQEMLSIKQILLGIVVAIGSFLTTPDMFHINVTNVTEVENC